MAIEDSFDVGFVAKLASEEKQLQQSYRPVIGVHKWFARRPGALFRALLLCEFSNDSRLAESYFEEHAVEDVTVCDPFMGGGTTLFEANRIGCNVVGYDINPMAYWVVRQELEPLDRSAFRSEAERVIEDVEKEVGSFYETECVDCGERVPVKYFFWVKLQRCGGCGEDLDLFPGYLIAKNDRHTHFVFHCPECKNLTQSLARPKEGEKLSCECGHEFDWRAGTASRNKYSCSCGHEGRYPAELRKDGPPRHRLFGMEYYCPGCRDSHKGRWFKTAEGADLTRFSKASSRREKDTDLPCPDARILDGDETKRLHRWGYRHFKEMFNARQLLSLGVLLRRIRAVENRKVRNALATVFSDFLRYQNMLCRYDAYALKCQDIFAVHGYPVGLVECENNVLGIPGIGSGAFRHFVEKYDRAKAYCESPFETQKNGKRKRVVKVPGERIEGRPVRSARQLIGKRKTFVRCGSVEDARLEAGSIDAVFTDPPYFDNVQYAELMDFCYSWLRLIVAEDDEAFSREHTRSSQELTGNVTAGRDLEHFTAGLSSVFRASAEALEEGAPFVFTYHHNDVKAYVPIVVAILDAGLECTATLPCPAEMRASLHIQGTGSSIVDTVVVCRKTNGSGRSVSVERETLERWLESDREKLSSGGIRCTAGDLYCMAMGHLARVSVATLATDWNPKLSTKKKIDRADRVLRAAVERCDVSELVPEIAAGLRREFSEVD